MDLGIIIIMSDSNSITISVSATVLSRATQQARKLGYKSLELLLENVIQRISKERLYLSSVEEPSTEYVTLTPRAQKRFQKIEEELKDPSKHKTFSSIDAMLDYLTKKSA